MNSGHYMPEHLVFDILLWLPVTSLLRFKSVCKSWHSLIDSPIFISQHFDHNSGNDNLLGTRLYSASIEYLKFWLLSGKKYELYYKFERGLPMLVVAEPELVFSSNGIICLVHDDKKISLWNPAMRQSRSLWVPYRKYSFFGFGFNAKSNDHNIVRTTLCNENTSKTLVEVYSLSADFWRTMHKDFAMPSRFYRSTTCQIVKDGILFWIAYSNGDDDTDGNIILSFDLNEETYETMPLPVGMVCHSAIIDFLDNKLAYIQRADHWYFEIWVLHKDGVKKFWNKALKLGPTDCLLYASYLISNGEFLLLTKSDSTFYLYNLRKNEYLEILEPDLRFTLFVRYTESLFSLKRVNDAY